MFQYNEHVEMNKRLCSLAYTWMTIKDSQFYIIDSLSLDVSETITWWLPGCKAHKYCSFKPMKSLFFLFLNDK